MKAPRVTAIGPLLISSLPTPPMNNGCMELRVVTARVLLSGSFEWFFYVPIKDGDGSETVLSQWFFYVPIRDRASISTRSSEPHKGLTICRCHSKGNTRSVGTATFRSADWCPTN